MVGDNSPCTVTRVIERTAERMAAVAKTLEADATVLRQSNGKTSADVVCIAADLDRDARELRQCAYQLTGKAY